MQIISLKLPEPTLEELSRRAEELRVSRSELMRSAIEQYLAQLTPFVRPPSALALAGGLIGSADGGPEDLSTNPDHLSDLGG